LENKKKEKSVLKKRGVGRVLEMFNG